MLTREEILDKAIEISKKNMNLYGIRSTDECAVAACQEVAEWAANETAKRVIAKSAEWLKNNTEALVNDFKQTILE